MGAAFMADISHFQPATIGAAYWPWSKAGDGVARIVFKATEGVGYKDPAFEGFWKQATEAGAGMIGMYHFARADLNRGPLGASKEAEWLASVVGKRLRENDRIMLDFEQNESAVWAHAFHDNLQAVLSRPIKPILYDSLSHFNQFFAADLSLAAKYDAAIAAWHPFVQGPPAAPKGWRMLWWQFSDAENVPGIGSRVDANVWLGGVPTPTLPPTVPPPAPTPDIAKAKLLLQEALAALG